MSRPNNQQQPAPSSAPAPRFSVLGSRFSASSPQASCSGAAPSSALGPRFPALSPRFSLYLALATFAVLWIDLIRQLSYTWSTDEQYAYGWFVPFLAFGLFLKKWPTRPPVPVTSPSSVISSPSRASAFRRFSVSAFVILVAFLLLPLRVIFETNPDWPHVAWPISLIVVALTLNALYLIGGLPWVKHFALPVCFILVAVRWPWRIEYPLTQGLMRIVAYISVEVLGWFNIPALYHGNLIQLSTGTVGVNEACSGIRSLQSTVMAALFLGELYLFRWPVRLLFLAVGVGLAFLLNVARALFLSWKASAGGVGQIEKWHDSAGFTIVLICFAALWLLAFFIRRLHQPSLLGSQPLTDSPRCLAAHPHSASRYLSAIGCWALCVILLTQIWYGAHSRTSLQPVRWSVVLPEANRTFETNSLPARTMELLQYDHGISCRWQNEDGSVWSVYFLRWEGKSTQSIMAARTHRPEVCLPAAGLTQVTPPQPGSLEAGSLRLPFQKSVYSAPGGPLYVFYFVWQDGDERRGGMRARTPSDRLVGPIEGTRRFGQQVLEVILSGYASVTDAETALHRSLPDLIRVERATHRDGDRGKD
jgi:exosortase